MYEQKKVLITRGTEVAEMLADEADEGGPGLTTIEVREGMCEDK